MCIQMDSGQPMWDNIGTVHNAVADYTPREPRHMRHYPALEA
ncbi:MAG: hypothetical protein QOF90_1700 [Acetobacteraceae bacterium]|jgi:alpha-ketoglutarate-dependent taurine dioxygenase|nr:hypothetical protein [Acetobacteraceae bacterium]